MTTFVYLVGREDGPVKVGITDSLLSRIRTLQTGSSSRISLLWVVSRHFREEARGVERRFHLVHKEERLSGEWFNMSVEQAIESLEQDRNQEEYYRLSGAQIETGAMQ